MDKQLANEIWYHGLLPREDIKVKTILNEGYMANAITNYGKLLMMLRINGDFLVRTTEPVAGKPRALVLSVMVKQEFEDQGVRCFLVFPRTSCFISVYLIKKVNKYDFQKSYLYYGKFLCKSKCSVSKQ
ncbi:hypothetical protein DICVIV_14237 [Dictyocaulus viviparus]|uniref:SH2 domain-containing protein n=1 Tax=Dictyocaulus viviparus TaxID=29172 RepID=A0A0D8XBM5_DICVI|nr:hypothetical protein DICVIV_14237 [Dictyocaulus viviparus]